MVSPPLFPSPLILPSGLTNLSPQARNSEKAQSMLFRFREAQAAELGIIDASRVRRPHAISTVTTVSECERWRGQVLKEISRKMTQIQDIALSDFQIRDLNDQLNKLMREKRAWESRIRALGGPNYTRAAAASASRDGSGGGGFGSGRGYQYYGRARELPGVKEMFEAEAQRRAREDDAVKDSEERRAELRRMKPDATYYGFGPDYEDDELLEYEKAREAQLREEIAANGVGLVPPEGWEPIPGDVGDGKVWELPSLEEVQEELINRRRRRLLEQL